MIAQRLGRGAGLLVEIETWIFDLDNTLYPENDCSSTRSMRG